MMKTKYHLSIFLIALFAGLMGFTTDAAAKENYGIKVGDVDVTSDNYTNISASGGFPAVKSGTVTFDPATNTLTLNNATIEGDIYSMRKSKSYTIVLQGNNTLKEHQEPINFNPSLRITGGGSLNIESSNVAISVEGDLTIDGCAITADRRIIVRGSLQINNSNVYVKAPFSGYTFQVLNGITLSGCKITQPAGAKIKKLKSFDGSWYTVVKTSGDMALIVRISTGSNPEPELPDELTFDPKELTLDANKNGQFVTLSYEMPYHIKDSDSPDWLSYSGGSTGYKESQKLWIFAQENPGAERTGTITFTVITENGEKHTVTLPVTQKAAGETPEPEQPAKLTFDPKELTLEAKENGQFVTLSCNKPFHVDGYDKPDWLSASGSSTGYKDRQELWILAQKNTGAERTGEITIKTTEGNVKLKVTQRGTGSTPSEPEQPAKFTLSPEKLEADASHNYKSVTLSCNVPYHVTDLKRPDWIGISGNSPGYEVSQELTIAILQNKTGKARTGTITFTVITDNGKKHTVTLPVTQQAASSTPSGTLTLDPMVLTMKYHRNEAEVTLACSDKAFSINQVVINQPGWLSATGYGSGLYKKHFIRITAQENPGAKRSGIVTFKTTEGEATLHVTQEAKSTAPPTLTLTPTTLTFAASGGASQSVAVKSSVEGWGVKLKDRTQDWLTVTPDAAAKTVIVAVKPNTGTKKRSAEVEVVSDAGLTRSFFVTQQGNRPPEAVSGLSLNPEAMTMGGSSGAVGFTLKSDKPWTVTADADWLHPGSTRGNAGTTYFRLRFDQNTTGAVRTGKLTFTTTDGKATKTFTLTQRVGSAKPKPSTPPEGTYDYDLAVNPESITLSGEGGGSTIDVVTHRLWAGSTADDWITLEKAVGRGDGSFDFTLAPNPSKEMRHGKITVRTEHGMDELTIAIHQQGQTGDIVLPGQVKVSGLTLDPATLIVDGDIASTLISALITPDDAANKSLLWMSSNPAVASVSILGQKRSGVALLPQLRFAPDADDYALVTIAGKGKATITAATSDGSGIVARCEIEVRSTVGNTVPYAPAARIYATPGTLHLSLPQATRVDIYTLLGIRLRTLDAPAGDTSVTLPRGLYVVKAGQAAQKVRIE